MAVLSSVLPVKYSPLQPSGRGNQVYLAEIPQSMAQVLAGLIGNEALNTLSVAEQTSPITRAPIERADLEQWERHIEQRIRATSDISETEAEALIIARRGQGVFKDRVMRIERQCRITQVDVPTHLVASHCKPWRDSTDDERLDGENGLLLTPTVDHLFDRGFISFEDAGRLIISPIAHRPSLQKMGIVTDEPFDVGQFSSGQKYFPDYHRDSVLLRMSR